MKANMGNAQIVSIKSSVLKRVRSMDMNILVAV